MGNRKFMKFIKSMAQYYNHKEYWNMRKKVIDKDSRLWFLILLYYLFRIKRMDAFNGASFGTHWKYGAIFYLSLIYHMEYEAFVVRIMQ